MQDHERLCAEAQRFDDDAIIAMANAGLLRRGRKLVEALPVVVASGNDGGLVATGGDWLVHVPAGSPLTTARCDCATAGVCQHVVAVILVLRDEQPAGMSHPATSAERGVRGDGEGLMVELCSVADDELRRWCAAAGMQWAIDRVAALDDGDVQVDAGAYLTVRMPTPLPTVRFMGRQLDAAVVDPGGRQDRRIVALALLCIWRRYGRALPASTPRVQPVTSDDRRQALDDAQAVVRDALRLGLLHLPESFGTRLDSVAAGARGASWYRLALVAERCVDELDGLERREATADSAVLLGHLAELSVLAEEMARSVLAGRAVPESLTGTARAAYEPVGDLDLVGCGHVRWGDAVFGGTIAVLAEIAARRVFTVSVATTVRGGAQSGGLAWNGSGSVTSLVGARVRLSGARASADLRLSNSAAVSVSTSPAVPASLVTALPWSGDEPGGASRLHGRSGWRWVVARIDAHGAAQFDPVRQVLSWPIRSADQEVAVEVAYSTSSATVMEALQHLVEEQPSHVVGRLRRAGGGLVLDPASLVIDDRFVVLAAGAPASQVTSARSPRGQRRRSAAAEPALQPDTVPVSPTAQVRSIVTRLAERGDHLGAAATLDQLVQLALDHGLTALATVVRAAPSFDVALVRAAWVLDEHDSYVSRA